MRKTKIVCTIGPATESEEKLRELMLAGMNVARLNFSHGSHEEHKLRIDRIKKIREELGLPVAILLDTKGPEYRIRTFENILGSSERSPAPASPTRPTPLAEPTPERPTARAAPKTARKRPELNIIIYPP